MRLNLVLGVALSGLAMPAFAAVPVPLPVETVPDVVREIFERIGLPEGNRAVYEGGQAAEEAGEAAGSESEEEFRCRIIRLIGAEAVCYL